MNSQSATIIAGAIIAAGLWFAAQSTGYGEAPAQSGRFYQLVAAGSGELAWRLNTQTGEVVACFPFGRATGSNEATEAGARCWQVSK